MKTKTSMVFDLYKAGDHNKALKILAGFRLLPRDQANIFKAAHAAIINPRLYIQLKSEAWVSETIKTGLIELDNWASNYEKNISTL